ncbi:DNA-directed RNA polymerase subunit beta [Bienertia sinuspersici]
MVEEIDTGEKENDMQCQNMMDDKQECVKIDFHEIQPELDYWASAVYCYIIGANPPVTVMEGFIKRVWGKYDVDKFRQKLKAVKQELKELNTLHFSNIHIETEDAHSSLLQIQKQLEEDPANRELCYKEKRATDQYKKKLHCYVQFLQQKARIKWLQEGDDNTTLFHRILKAQRLRSNLIL